MKKLVCGLILLFIVYIVCYKASKYTTEQYLENNVFENNETTYQADVSGKSLGDGYFIVINSWGIQGATDTYYIVYAKDTKVKYFIMQTTYRFGITPLYNADGTLQIYDEEEIAADEIP